MKFSKKNFKMFNDLSALEKGAILPFVQSGNIDISSLTGIEPGTCASKSDPLTNIPNFLIEKFSKIVSRILRDFYNLSMTESPVESSNNR